MASSVSKLKLNKGFTFIEILIVLVVIAILIIIAYPIYIDKVKRTYRITAQQDLLSLAAALEQFHHQYYTYIGAGSDGNQKATGEPTIYSSVSPSSGEDKPRYAITITAASLTSFELKATPINAQEDDGRVTLNSVGMRCWYEGYDTTGGVCQSW